MTNDSKYDGPDRRRYFRHNLMFSPRQKAKLKIGDRVFDVIDFSEGGLRFRNEDNLDMNHRLRGTLIYPEDKSTEIDGKVIWNMDKEVGLQYIA